MAKIATGQVWKPAPRKKKTSQGNTNSSIKTSSMSKSRKRSYKEYRGQGR